jgi:hypothetical protein
MVFKCYIGDIDLIFAHVLFRFNGLPMFVLVENLARRIGEQAEISGHVLDLVLFLQRRLNTRSTLEDTE